MYTIKINVHDFYSHIHYIIILLKNKDFTPIIFENVTHNSLLILNYANNFVRMFFYKITVTYFYKRPKPAYVG